MFKFEKKGYWNEAMAPIRSYNGSNHQHHIIRIILFP